MTRQPRYYRILALAALVLLAGGPLLADQELHRVWAVKDARIVTLAGPPIEKGTLIIRDGLIEAVGAGLPIPKDAEVIDGAKLTVYPGLIDGLGQSLLKLPEEKIDRAAHPVRRVHGQGPGHHPQPGRFRIRQPGQGGLREVPQAGLYRRPGHARPRRPHRPVGDLLLQRPGQEQGPPAQGRLPGDRL